jgi:hypothetical protein
MTVDGKAIKHPGGQPKLRNGSIIGRKEYTGGKSYPFSIAQDKPEPNQIEVEPFVLGLVQE